MLNLTNYKVVYLGPTINRTLIQNMRSRKSKLNVNVIVTSNLNIAGIQRLSLDQAYYLSDLGRSVTIFCLVKNSSDIVTFKTVENDLIERKNIRIAYLDRNLLFNLLFLKRFIKENRIQIVISHSQKGTFIFRVFRLFTKNRFKIITTIHQLLDMSPMYVRLKIVLLSLFTDILQSYSVSVKENWYNFYSKKNILKYLVNYKPIEICRNGVYIDRLKSLILPPSNSGPRLIFVGRLTQWKGLGVILDLMKTKEFEDYSLLILSMDNIDAFNYQLDKKILKRITILNGKVVTDIHYYNGDVHLYPVNYKLNPTFTESVGMNVLEMCALGVPSLVPIGGDVSWPELTTEKIIIPVDFSNSSEIKLKLNEINSTFVNLIKIREIVSVSNNIKQILSK